MIYHFLKVLMQISLRFFFRNVQVKGLENIPQTGPLLIVSNHPNTVLDPIVIGCYVDRKIFFLAAAKYFKSGFAKWLLPKFNMIPVFRAQDNPDELKNNDEVFSKCYDHLKKDGVILIFPEGISLTNRQLKKIKTGAARIALGAEAANAFTLNVRIVSIGLNYSDPHNFRSDVFINIDEPIEVMNYKARYSENDIAAVNKMTDEIRSRLEKHIIAIEDAAIDELVKKIEIIYKSQLLKDLGYTPKIKEHDFIVTKAINEEVHYYYRYQPQRVEQFKREIDEYFRILDRLKLSDRVLKKFPGQGSILMDTMKSVFYMLIGLPVFIYGFINNYIPYRLPGIITNRLNIARDFYGALYMLIGTLSFLIFYGLQITLMHYFFQNILITICYAVTLPVTGLFAYYYARRYKNMRGRWLIFSLFYRKTSLITAIINMRQHIIDELERGRKEYTEMGL